MSVKKWINAFILFLGTTSLLISLILIQPCLAQTGERNKKIAGVQYITSTVPGKWRNAKKLSCTLITTFGVDSFNSNAHLFGPSLKYVDDEGVVYITDAVSRQIKVYHPSGKLIQVIAENRSKNIFFPNDMVFDAAKNSYCFSRRSNRINIFNPGWQLLKSLSQPGINYLFSCKKSKKLFALAKKLNTISKQPSQQGFIIPFSMEGFQPPAFGRPTFKLDESKSWLYTSLLAKCRPDGRIILAFLYPHEIQIYNNQQLETVITRKDPVFHQKYNYRDIELTRRRFGSIITLPDNKFMIGFLDRGEDWLERAKQGDITSYPAIVYDLYDSDGTFLQHFEPPNKIMGLLSGCDSKGCVYETSLPDYNMKAGDYVIKKYRIEFEDKF